MFTLRPGPILACIFYKNPGAKVCWNDVVKISEQIRFPIFPDIDLDTIIESVKENHFFEVDSDGDIICPQELTQVDLYEFLNRLPDSLAKEIFDAS